MESSVVPVLKISVFVFVCVVNIPVKVSSFPLCQPFDGMKESGVRGGAVYIYSSAVELQVEGRSYGN